MQKIIIFLIFFSLVSLEAQELCNLWQKIESSDDGVVAADDSFKASKKKQDSAKSMYLPKITLVGTYTHLDEPVKIEGKIDLSALPIPLPGAIPYRADLTKQDVFLANLHLLWPLYTGGRIDAAQDIFKAQVDEEKAKKQMKKDTLFLRLVKYYYGVVVAKSLYATMQKAESASLQLYKNAQKLKQNAQIAQVELIAAKAKYEQSKQRTLEAKHKLEIAQSALNSLSGLTTLPKDPLFILPPPKDEKTYADEATKNYAPLKIFDAKERQSASLLTINKAAWHPTVAAFGNYALYKDDSPLMSTLPTWFAGVMVKFDILSRSDRGEKIEMAKLLNDKVRHLKQKAQKDLALLAKKTYKELEAAYEEFYSLEASIELAKENYRLRSLAFNEGLSTSLEVSQAQALLQGVQTKRLNAAYTFVQKLSQLCVLSGERESFFTIAKTAKEVR